MSELLDDPNRQVLGLDPAWVEGTGGEGGEAAAEPEAASGYEAMTKAELLEEAQERGISPANNDMTKAELVAALEA